MEHRLDWLLDYEIRASSRYRRYCAIIFVAAEDGEGNDWRPIQGALRDCDFMECVNGKAGILMPETDLEGVQRAVVRLNAGARGVKPLRFSCAVFPHDAHQADELLAVASRRLEHALCEKAETLRWLD